MAVKNKPELTCAEMICDARRERGWTILDLAAKLGIRSNGYISRLEDSHLPTHPSPQMCRRLRDAFGWTDDQMHKLIDLIVREKTEEAKTRLWCRYRG